MLQTDSGDTSFCGLADAGPNLCVYANVKSKDTTPTGRTHSPRSKHLDFCLLSKSSNIKKHP
jgi:hypothetical protein